MQITALNTLPNFINCILQELGPVQSIVKSSPEVDHKKITFSPPFSETKFKLLSLPSSSSQCGHRPPSLFRENHKTTRNRNIPSHESALEHLFPLLLFPALTNWWDAACEDEEMTLVFLHSRGKRGQSMEASHHQSWNGAQNPLSIFQHECARLRLARCWQVGLRKLFAHKLSCSGRKTASSNLFVHASLMREKIAIRETFCCRYIATGIAGWLHSKEKKIISKGCGKVVSSH